MLVAALIESQVVCVERERMLVQFKGLSLNAQRRELSYQGRIATLPNRAFEVLQLLVDSADLVVSREKIMASVWGDNFDPGTKILDVQLTRIRRELHLLGSKVSIRNLRGQGFILCE
jgi:DNA-binding response OmpR family regulator